jgi:glycosyltransferase involved in cell wall biosynthesis
VEENQVIASIIIPMKNEASFIGPCLDSVLANDFPRHKYEILVVDGNSTDGSRYVVASYMSAFPQIRLLQNPAGIVSTAMNTGIRQSRGDYIIRMDAHSEYPPNYIRTCIEELERTGAESVGGCAITKPGANTLLAEAIAWITQHPVGVGNAAYRLGQGDRFVDTVPFGTFRRALFDRIGLYREDLVRNQDYELNTRIRQSGGRIYLSSKTNIVYYNVPTFLKFMAQAYSNGVYVAQMWLRNPASFCWRHGAPLLFAAGLMASLALGTLSAPLRPILLAFLVLYLLVIMLASFQISFKRGSKYLLVLPGLFFSCHLVYGLGTILGLTRSPHAGRAASQVPSGSASVGPVQ